MGRFDAIIHRYITSVPKKIRKRTDPIIRRSVKTKTSFDKQVERRSAKGKKQFSSLIENVIKMLRNL